MFNSTLHAGEVKANIILAMAISAQAINQKYTQFKKTPVGDNPAFTFRTFLLRLGLIGPEYKNVRMHLLKNLPGDKAWRHDKSLYPQVWKFIDMMLESGILARNILLITNATCITDDVANMLAEKHVSVQVSLNGSRAELHDSICGKGNFERTMAGLQRLLSKHANMVIVRNMMNKQNMNDNWDMFCEKLIDMGVHKIMLAGLKKVGRANENLEKIALTPLEYQSLIDRLKESKVITGINDEYRKLAGDEAESNIRIDIPVPYSGVCPYVYQDENPVPISPRIATNGDVYLCQSFMDQRYCLGNINKDSLPHALFNENFINLVNFMTTGRFYMDDCNKCVLKYQCPRGCIGDCLANGSIHETDGGCFFRKENAIRQLLKQSEAIVAEHMQF